MAPTTTRHKILSHFRKFRTATAREISRGLKISPAAARHHLRILVLDERLEIAPTRSREGRGRPEKRYSIPRAALGDNLSALAEAIWAKSGLVDLEAVAKRLAGLSVPPAQTTARNLHLAVERLNQMHYHARWEAGAGGPRIIFAHCPYAAILEHRPELCQMDVALLHELAGSSAEAVATIKEGNSNCIFAMRH